MGRPPPYLHYIIQPVQRETAGLFFFCFFSPHHIEYSIAPPYNDFTILGKGMSAMGGKIIHITEQVYRGIKCSLAKDSGWKITLGDEEYLFPNFQDAQIAIDRSHEAFVRTYGAKKLKIVTTGNK